ncbi:hypothetical protein AA0114_g9930 [Alternaria tenuissima]|uniref:Uncharacterized protein n=1 Tax=Alternaria tenuissima TaxID=119927 RepID=A0A4Q4M5F5_9PLEO|nr:hypothetical protein AA0114_g9930 [Alternaria tenuissima]
MMLVAGGDSKDVQLSGGTAGQKGAGQKGAGQKGAGHAVLVP